MKECNKCKCVKNIKDFYLTKSGIPRSICKTCHNKESKEYREENYDDVKNKKKIYRIKNRELISEKEKIRRQLSDAKKVSEYQKKYQEENKEKIKQKKREYYLKNREEIINRSKSRLLYKKDEIKEYQKNYKKIKNNKRNDRRKNDLNFKLSLRVRSMVYNSFKNNGYRKNSRTFEIIGCSFNDLKAHLESKFEYWMNWENRGLYNGEFEYGWDIDHIIPISSAKTEEDIIRLNHYNNLRPLCSKINRDIKKANY